MNKNVRLVFAEAQNLSEIGIGVICSNARYVFDQPVAVLADEAIEVRDGQFFLVSKPFGVEVYFPLSGKWDR